MKPLTYRYALRITGNHWDAEDLTQDVLIKLNQYSNRTFRDPDGNMFSVSSD
jgi:DNA-directed RNA polymerase specialized sigma24 family protein